MLALAAGVKQLLPSRRETAITRAAASLKENKGGAEDETFGYIDPKVGSTDGAGGGGSRSRAAYGQAIIFVVGPGNYLEYQTVRHRASQVVYGCTEVLTATEFLAQLAPRGGNGAA